MLKRILHTADWHLGKRLHNIDFLPFQEKFLNHLIQLIQEKKIHILLVSGDIFDQANPSNEARKLYYGFLAQLINTECRLILTGGNHDSPHMLNAPRDLLDSFNFHIVGHFTDDPSRMVIPIQDRDGITEMVVAAIPFLRDADIRKFSERGTEEDRLEQIRLGIRQVFAQMVDTCQENYPNIPAIAMGHLFMQHAEPSESERDIQLGNQAGIPQEYFPDYFEYYALGHIHNPQTISKTRRIYYSGSPYPLSFSESEHEKRLVLLEWDGELFNVTSLPLESYIDLIKISGSIQKLKTDLDHLKSRVTSIPKYIELVLKSDTYDSSLKLELEEMIENFDHDLIEIVKHRIEFSNQKSEINKLFEQSISIEDLNPNEVFRKKLEASDISKSDKLLMLEAFDEIVQELMQEGGGK